MTLASLGVAWLGFLDDRHSLSARLRLVGQAIAIGLSLAAAIPLTDLANSVSLPWLAAIVAAFVGTLYWINLFNFMDGIDGLAASEALFLVVAAAILLMLGTDLSALTFWCAGLAAALAGFLVFNWPPARIFMGDVGSTYLGFVLAFLALLTIADGAISVWSWAILVALFVVDATVTLGRRLARRDNITQAHRSHAYQRLSRRWRSHRAVTGLFIGLDVVLLFPLALWCQLHPEWGAPLAVALYLVLAVIAWSLGAGVPDNA